MAAAQKGNYSGVSNIDKRRYDNPRNIDTQLVEIHAWLA
jgi:hypothetical protein